MLNAPCLPSIPVKHRERPWTFVVFWVFWFVCIFILWFIATSSPDKLDIHVTEEVRGEKQQQYQQDGGPGMTILAHEQHHEGEQLHESPIMATKDLINDAEKPIRPDINDGPSAAAAVGTNQPEQQITHDPASLSTPAEVVLLSESSAATPSISPATAPIHLPPTAARKPGIMRATLNVYRAMRSKFGTLRNKIGEKIKGFKAHNLVRQNLQKQEEFQSLVTPGVTPSSMPTSFAPPAVMPSFLEDAAAAPSMSPRVGATLPHRKIRKAITIARHRRRLLKEW